MWCWERSDGGQSALSGWAREEVMWAEMGELTLLAVRVLGGGPPLLGQPESVGRRPKVRERHFFPSLSKCCASIQCQALCWVLDTGQQPK